LILKIPTFIELTNDFLHNGYSVVIFVNYTQTLKILKEMLHTDSIVYGEQDSNDRLRIIEEFQENKLINYFKIAFQISTELVKNMFYSTQSN